MKSLALLVSVLLAIGLLGGPLAMHLATKFVRTTHSSGRTSYKAGVATLAALSIVVNVMFLIGHVPALLRIISFLALCTGLIAIKKLYFLKS
jgi:hypothetical protein